MATIDPTRFTHRTKMFPIATVVLEKMLRTGMIIEIFEGLPDDAVITSIQKSINQDAYIIQVRSSSFPKSRRYDTMEVMDNIRWAFHRGKKYGYIGPKYNRVQKLAIKLFRIKA